MSVNGVPLFLTVNAVVNGYGDNTLVWEPVYSFGSAPAGDVHFAVNVNNVVINSTPQSFSYDVTMFDLNE